MSGLSPLAVIITVETTQALTVFCIPFFLLQVYRFYYSLFSFQIEDNAVSKSNIQGGQEFKKCLIQQHYSSFLTSKLNLHLANEVCQTLH